MHVENMPSVAALTLQPLPLQPLSHQHFVNPSAPSIHPYQHPIHGFNNTFMLNPYHYCMSVKLHVGNAMPPSSYHVGTWGNAYRHKTIESMCNDCNEIYYKCHIICQIIEKATNCSGWENIAYLPTRLGKPHETWKPCLFRNLGKPQEKPILGFPRLNPSCIPVYVKEANVPYRTGNAWCSF